jgi:hypothetical protein
MIVVGLFLDAELDRIDYAADGIQCFHDRHLCSRGKEDDIRATRATLSHA